MIADISNDASIFKVSQLNFRRSPPISIRVVQVLDPGTKPFAQTFPIPISRGSILLSLRGVSFLDQGILAPAGPEFPRAVPSRPGKSRSAPEKCRSAPEKCRSAPGRCRSAPGGSGKVPKCSRIPPRKTLEAVFAGLEAGIGSHKSQKRRPSSARPPGSFGGRPASLGLSLSNHSAASQDVQPLSSQLLSGTGRMSNHSAASC